MSHKKPEPLFPPRSQKRCPVCGEASYSPSGAHPQCLARQADQKRTDRIKKSKRAASQKVPVSRDALWQKRCPKCKKTQHVRTRVCTCGHPFALRARPPTSETES